MAPELAHARSLCGDPLTERFLSEVEGSFPEKPSRIATALGVDTVRVLAACNVLVGRGRAALGPGGTYVRHGGR